MDEAGSFSREVRLFRGASSELTCTAIDLKQLEVSRVWAKPIASRLQATATSNSHGVPAAALLEKNKQFIVTDNKPCVRLWMAGHPIWPERRF